MSDDHHTSQVESPGQIEVSNTVYIVSGVLIALGVFGFIAGYMKAPHRAWRGYLIGFWFSLSLGLSGPVFAATQYLSKAGWSASIRRIPESFGYFLIPALGFALIALFGASELFIWMHPHDIHDHVMKHIIHEKEAFLNFKGLAFTTVTSIVAWIAGFFWMRKNSVKQDETGEAELTESNKIASSVFMFLFVIGFSFMSWYWIMSLEPKWFSTMFQVYTFAGLFQAGLAVVALIVLAFRERDILGDLLGERQILRIGQLVFAFTIFYAYIAFSQFFLIWYSNIPEEAHWFVHRILELPGEWIWFAALWSLKFIIPFLVLLPKDHKLNHRNVLRYVCYLLIFAFGFEIWWWVSFTPHHGEVHVVVPWIELLITAGFSGVFVLTTAWGLSSANLVPENDPYLHESLEHHHHGSLPQARDDIEVSTKPME